MRPFLLLPVLAALLLAPVPQAAAAAQEVPGGPPVHGVRPQRLLVRDVMVLRGNATPPIGPTHVLVEGGTIAEMGAEALRRAGDPPPAVVDGRGRFLLPGFISTHTHLQESAAGLPMDPRYQYHLWLACGITSIRDTGSTLSRTLRVRARSEAGEIAAPRIFIYTIPRRGRTEEEVRAAVRAARTGGADGLKVFGMDRDLLSALMDEARKLDLRVTTHIGVQEVTARDLVDMGVTSIEHWYGIPEAAMAGVQDFPPWYSYTDEVHRFREAGRLWRQTDPARLEEFLRYMAEKGVAWSPTLAIYDATRDVRAAQTRPWFADHLHPALEEFFRPDPGHHGSFFLGWTNTDEVRWRENYRIWMAAVKRFAELGGTVTTGEDAGFIYQVYGYGFLRELEMQEEAGFHPLEVLRNATVNGARVLGQEHRLGRIRPGFAADLLVVHGNPVADLRVLYPGGTDSLLEGRPVRAEGIQWTIKDGIPYHVPRLMEEVRQIVAAARRRTASGETGEAGGGG